MNKVNFQDGTKIKDAVVVIDGQEYTVVPAQYQGTTPLSKFNLNKMQDNMEEAAENKLILNKTIEADTTNNITLLTSLQEGLYEFIIDGYLPGNSAFYFEDLIDTNRFSYAMTNTQLLNSTISTQFWTDSNVATNLPIARL